jgi:hypothetical protein
MPDWYNPELSLVDNLVAAGREKLSEGVWAAVDAALGVPVSQLWLLIESQLDEQLWPGWEEGGTANYILDAAADLTPEHVGSFFSDLWAATGLGSHTDSSVSDVVEEEQYEPTGPTVIPSGYKRRYGAGVWIQQRPPVSMSTKVEIWDAQEKKEIEVLRSWYEVHKLDVYEPTLWNNLTSWVGQAYSFWF